MTRQAFRAGIFHLLQEPSTGAGDGWHDDGVLVIEDGVVIQADAWQAIGPGLPADMPVRHFPGALIVPWFVDAHVHYPQIDMIAAPGGQLMEWLENYTFPTEARFADRAHADATAAF
ncbi:MAG TPA: hypothetical protein VFQ52_07945, partial [Rhizomicrobium sp.]|nr:hypothetical protein [Rhizomicrobium sp.]